MILSYNLKTFLNDELFRKEISYCRDTDILNCAWEIIQAYDSCTEETTIDPAQAMASDSTEDVNIKVDSPYDDTLDCMESILNYDYCFSCVCDLIPLC